MQEYAFAYYAPLIKRIKSDGIAPLEEYLISTYAAEEVVDEITVVREGEGLRALVRECPAVRHIRTSGRDVSRWYRLTTQTVMGTIALASGFQFTMLAYDEQTGRAEYTFSK